MLLEENKYDYIIAGGGLAGLSLAYKLSLAPAFGNKRILIIDKDTKNKNDRTWCYWSKDKSIFDSIIHHRWQNIKYAAPALEQHFSIEPYRYNMIRGIDFYNFCLEHLRKLKTVDIKVEEIAMYSEQEDAISVRTTQSLYSARYIFKSYPDKLGETTDHFVWQHFKGWIIETTAADFDPDQAVFMDFRVVQGEDTRFFYVLPVSKHKALVELAIFSKDIPELSFYEGFLTDYIKNKLQLQDYNILHEEWGAIPMTTKNFQHSRTKRLIPIGTNGGSVKASSGFAFTRIQRDIDHLLPYILEDKLDNYKVRKNRFSFYDRIMLNAILSKKTTGEAVFTNLFKKLKPQTIFKFLDEEGSFFNDLKIFTAPPTLPFLRAFFEECAKK